MKQDSINFDELLAVNSPLYNAIQSRFDKVYILSLVNRKDRRVCLDRQLYTFGINPYINHFIEYYYGTTFPYNNIIAQSFNQTNKGRFTKPNEYDCARNHYAIVKICYELGYEHCLIMEDDILFLKDVDKIVDYIKEIPNDFDVVQFGGFTADPKIIPLMKGDKWFKHKNVGIWNCSMYALSRKGMQFYLAFMDKMFWVADGPVYKAPLNDKIINTYLCNVPIVIQADKEAVSSDIRNAKNDNIDYNTQNLYEKNINKSDYFECR